jgi:hypothetical protein
LPVMGCWPPSVISWLPPDSRTLTPVLHWGWGSPTACYQAQSLNRRYNCTVEWLNTTALFTLAGKAIFLPCFGENVYMLKINFSTYIQRRCTMNRFV